MRSVKMIEEYCEGDVKPAKLLEKYIKLTEADVAQYLLNGDALHDTPCPGCHSAEIASSFERFGMEYVECASCHTLRVNPRPSEQAINDYYLYSAAERFWRDELSKITRAARLEKIITPRLDWIIDSTQQHLPDAEHIVDIKTHQDGYDEALVSLDRFSKKTLLNPVVLETCAGVEVVSGALDDGSADVISMFEVVDKTSDIDDLFASVYRALRPGGLCFVTNILSSGFDIQILWDKAENILPPDRLNLFSVEGFNALIERHGFECLEFSTPGLFDVEIVANAIKKNPSLSVPKFVSYMLENRNDDDLNRFQLFLQASLMSSYGRILIRKP